MHKKDMEAFRKFINTKIATVNTDLEEQRFEYYEKDKEIEEKMTDKINVVRKENSSQ
jgi:hypothetical protein